MSLLRLKNVAFPRSPRSNIQGFDLTMEPGECIVVFGRSGLGKTTLMKLAAGVFPPGAGEVVITDPRPKSRMPVSYVPKEGGLLANATLLQNVVLPVIYHKVMGFRDSRKRALELMREFRIDDLADRLPAVVGGTSKKLAQVARALLVDPVLYVLDEPFMGLDASASRAMTRILSKIKKDGRAGVLLATGDVTPFLDWADRFAHVRRKSIRMIASREELLGSEDPEIKDFLSHH